ncbi:geranylgeranylglyceryl phosphate synthase [miscellaneous Crenarchaeota group-1 archaeon SG8-32-3]|uniref:Geranylgeranylglyceryl phosphate synthase n=1 Tax=miscellaneous Crenarchaeota group-1 archaeon SG8-32-3 TaxID=1685125 RepID=A0A0M0BV41_9ARCH|nr:MAG: geranylgeranylglyceryl phosphate synthase [miscellaneous Crenarchaeota group-1 archaeon SG8-32-3]
MFGRVEKYLLEKIKAEGSIHMTLVDPEKTAPSQAAQVAENSQANGTAAIMIGGSTFVSQAHLDDVIKAMSRIVKIPIILFPNNITGISRYADAIWFMSLLNSVDPYFLIGAQILGAPLVKKYGLEPISMGYIIVGEGGTAGVVGKAIPVPYNKPELTVAHALAGQYLGMHFIYLEGGSGAAKPVPPEMIRMVKKSTEIPLLVGGGIRTKKQALSVASAGADIIVTGNIVESIGGKQKVSEIIDGVKGNRG